MSKKRPSIPQWIKLQVWTEAAGRCQFKNCNKPLWFNELTLNKRNFSKLAHIIGASKDGPRGNKESELLAKDPSNIMLLCSTCHDEIDDGILKDLYSVEDLRSMKYEHTNRIRMLIDVPSRKSRPFILTSQIGGQNTMFGERSIKSALLPDYPDKPSDDWFWVEIGSFDRKKLSGWKNAQDIINQNIDSLDRACKYGTIGQISVFGLTYQPLLMWFGRRLGDKVTTQIFEPRRSDDLDKKWAWDNDDGKAINYESVKLKSGNCKDVILLLALSDYLQEDKYDNMLSTNAHVYSLTIDKPVQGYLTKKSQKAAFIQSCRGILNKIQADVGKDCIIHVLPAMPASLAIEFGRLIQPTKDPSIWVYENISGEKPEKIFELL